jgi:hypothetical protein
MVALQDLFLVSTPFLVEGVERVDLNANTRMLVRRVFKGTDVLRRLEHARRAISGEIRADKSRRARIGEYIRQAISLERLRRYGEAEQTLVSALEEDSSDPDLVGQLGVLYSLWQPVRREADARTQFTRAAQLKCTREEVYRRWADMELAGEAWSAAAEAVELGIERVGPAVGLLWQAGYARSRLGRELRRGFLNERADEELRAADRRLRQALSELEQVRYASEWGLRGRIYRALVLNCEGLGWLDEMHRFLDRWEAECPGDWYLLREAPRLRDRYPART